MLPATSIPAERSLAPALYLTVISFAAGSSSVEAIRDVALRLRWVSLFILTAVALAVVAGRLRERWRLPGLWFAPLPAAFAALAALSAVWSVNPSLTLRKTASFAILLLAAAALGAAAGLDRSQARRLLGAIVAGGATVAALGLAVLVVSPEQALQGLHGARTLRYRGFGANPNTAAMLYAVTLPLAGWLALSAYTLRVRVAAGATAVLFSGSVIASLSRGALLACLFGASVVALTLVVGVRRKAGTLAAIFVVFFAGNALRGLDAGPAYPPEVVAAVEARQGERDVSEPGPAAPAPAAPPAAPAPAAPAPPAAAPAAPAEREPLTEITVRPEDEIGHPTLGLTTSTAGSGRAAAWKGAVEEIRKRPILGTGFGTEPIAFTDHWYFFQGSYPENAYLGLLLQLGGVGLSLFLLVGILLLIAGAGSIRGERGENRGMVAATLGVVVAGAVLMLTQSYVYSVGNIASATFWIGAFILAALAGRPTLTLPWAQRRPG